MAPRENWSSKIGIIMAVAGSAVGLGNFLRFPVKAAAYGGGAFMIPYLIAFVFLGIPLAWMEWTLGRYGGRYGHGTAPGILDQMIKKPWAKYAGSLGLFAPVFISFYYVFIQSWLLAFAWYSLTGELSAAVHAGQINQFFSDFIMLRTCFGPVPSAIIFLVITFAMNMVVISSGVRKGIERINKIGMPVLFIMGIILVVRVLTIPGISRGLAYMWNPNFSALKNPQMWLEASGQVFFTLSLGMGIILCYASYLKPKQDLVLSSLTANGANEFAEVILGGTIVIPMAVLFFGSNITEVAKLGTFGLGFQAMPIVFGKIPLGNIFQFLWFAMLFSAGVTSAISILQPLVSFCEDDLKFSRRSSVTAVGVLTFLGAFIAVFGLSAGAVDEMDFWGGSFMLVLFGTIQAFLFSYVLGMDKGWELMNEGASFRLPAWFKPIFKYVTPFYLAILLIAWTATQGWDIIALRNVSRTAMVSFCGIPFRQVTFIWISRGFLVLTAIFINVCIAYAWKSGRATRGRETAVHTVEAGHAENTEGRV